MASSHDYRWREISTGVHVRPLDVTEKHYVGMGAAYGLREWGQLSMLMKLRDAVPDLPQRARQAWKAIRHQHPLLASVVDRQERRVYRVADVDEWLDETLIVHAAGFWPSGKPIRRATLHLLPARNELVLQTSHHSMDGQAALGLANRLLELLDRPPQADVVFGHEAVNLAPPLRDVAPLPHESNRGLRICRDQMNEWFAGFPSVGLGASLGASAPGDTRALRMKLSVEETASAITTAKNLGLTPTHVIEAAVILAAREIDGDQGRDYCSCGLFSLRSQCDPAWRSATVPYLAIVPQRVPPASFMDTARHIKAYYNQWKSDMKTLMAVAEPTLLEFAEMVKSPSGPNTMISVSSFGLFEPLLESKHGSVELADFWFLYETPDPGVTSFTWTRQGQLSWQVCYNEAFHDEKTIARWVERTRLILLEGLGLPAGGTSV